MSVERDWADKPEGPRRLSEAWRSSAFVVFPLQDVEQSIPDRFEAQANKYPQRVAVKTMHQTLTFADLNSEANQVAHAILQDAERDARVALLVADRTKQITASIAALKAGKAYVPLATSLPAERVGHVLNETEVDLVVTDDRGLPFTQKLIGRQRRVLNVDDLPASRYNANVRVTVPPDAVAYINYTSGSTGRPKGVVQNHRSILLNVRNNTNTLFISRVDRLSLLRSSNVGAANDIWAALLNGAGLFSFDLAEEGVGNLKDWLIGESITIYISVSTVFRHFVRTLTGGESFPNLRLISVGGEPVYKSDVELYKHHFAEAIFANRLGISETNTVAYYFIDAATEIQDDKVPVGYALEDKEILVLDEQRNEVPAHEIGEIAVRSRHLALGYWKQPDLTDAKFVSAEGADGARTHLTGDLGYMSQDGCLTHLGRKDFLVKIRGHRVEIAEVEMALRDVPTVTEAAVQAFNDSNDEKRLAAYIVFETGGGSIAGIRACLGERLPSYMLPAFFVVLDALPMTAHGKLDRRALPLPEALGSRGSESFVAPRGPLENVLTRVCTDILGVDGIGVHDPLLDVGFDSLLASQLMLRIKQIFDLEIPVSILFENATIAKLAECLAENERSSGQTNVRAELFMRVDGMPAQDLEKAINDERAKRRKTPPGAG